MHMQKLKSFRNRKGNKNRMKTLHENMSVYIYVLLLTTNRLNTSIYTGCSLVKRNFTKNFSRISEIATEKFTFLTFCIYKIDGR